MDCFSEFGPRFGARPCIGSRHLGTRLVVATGPAQACDARPEREELDVSLLRLRCRHRIEHFAPALERARLPGLMLPLAFSRGMWCFGRVMY